MNAAEKIEQEIRRQQAEHARLELELAACLQLGIQTPRDKISRAKMDEIIARYDPTKPARWDAKHIHNPSIIDQSPITRACSTGCGAFFTHSNRQKHRCDACQAAFEVRNKARLKHKENERRKAQRAAWRKPNVLS